MSPFASNSFLRFKLLRLRVLVIKLAVVFGAGFFVYHKLMHNDQLQFEVFWDSLQKYHLFGVYNVVGLLFLSFLNWFLETYKWKIIVRHVEKISFLKAWEQTLGSLTASIFTPNRIGEYGAKALYFKSDVRKQILGLTLIANLTQLSVTVFFGVIGFGYFLWVFNPLFSYYRLLRMLLLLAIFGYFFISNTNKSKFKIKGYGFSDLKRFLNSISVKTIVKLEVFSVLRYIVFSYQFYVLLHIFKVDVSYFTAMVLISTFYLILSVIPTLFILDVLVKGSVALWLFGFVHANEVAVLSSVLLMWLLNFAIPSIVGSYFVLKFKMVKA